MKTCSSCNLGKELSEFHPDKSGRDGLRSICKECTNERIAKKRELRKEGIGLIHITEKQCNKCLETKPIHMFYKDVANVDGYYSLCKICKTGKTVEWRKANREKYNKTQRDYQKGVPAEKRYGVEIKRRYGCTLEDYNRMVVEQEGACAVCKKLHDPGRKKGRLYVDHDHATGKVRALLCHNCNCLLGYAKDDTRVMLEAVAYVIKHKKVA